MYILIVVVVLLLLNVVIVLSNQRGTVGTNAASQQMATDLDKQHVIRVEIQASVPGALIFDALDIIQYPPSCPLATEDGSMEVEWFLDGIETINIQTCV